MGKLICPGCGAVIDPETMRATFTADESLEGGAVEPDDAVEAETESEEQSGEADAPQPVSGPQKRRNRFFH